jgi:NAD(P)H-hydrate epimerase
LPLVVDADALNLLAENPVTRDNWVLTPHPGEAARLLQMSPAQVEGDRFTAVEDIAVRYGGAAVLKGAGSLVAGRDGALALCTAGNPGMSTGGMGDVLTGIIAGLIAQGSQPVSAARAGVFIHGRAGDLAALTGERGLLAMDLMPHIRELVNPVAP